MNPFSKFLVTLKGVGVRDAFMAVIVVGVNIDYAWTHSHTDSHTLQ